MDILASNLLLILCFVVGTGLIILEAFLPGFGIAGISGVVLEIAAIYLTWARLGMGPALIALAAVLLIIGITVFLSYRSAMKGRLSRSPLILHHTETAESASLESGAAGESPWIGRSGEAATPLRPAGWIDIEGRRLSAATSGEFLEKGVPVRVIGVRGDHLLIQRQS